MNIRTMCSAHATANSDGCKQAEAGCELSAATELRLIVSLMEAFCASAGRLKKPLTKAVKRAVYPICRLAMCLSELLCTCAGRLKKPTKAAVKKAARSARWDGMQPMAATLAADRPAIAGPQPQQSAGEPVGPHVGVAQSGASQGKSGQAPPQAPMPLTLPGARLAASPSSFAKAMQRQQEVDRYIDK